MQSARSCCFEFCSPAALQKHNIQQSKNTATSQYNYTQISITHSHTHTTQHYLSFGKLRFEQPDGAGLRRTALSFLIGCLMKRCRPKSGALTSANRRRLCVARSWDIQVWRQLSALLCLRVYACLLCGCFEHVLLAFLKETWIDGQAISRRAKMILCLVQDNLAGFPREEALRIIADLNATRADRARCAAATGHVDFAEW